MHGISCIICAYNEAGRIGPILDAARACPALAEIIVVDDGSTDDTHAAAAAAQDIRVISYASNRGKTYAMAQGVAAARGDKLMFLDADLDGLTAREISALAAPVLTGRAEATLSLRRNSLGLYRRIGLDFVTGERVVPAWLLAEQVPTLERLPRWGAETFINACIIAAGLRVEVVAWPSVANVRKYVKSGLLQGMAAELDMVGDALKTLPLDELVRQNLDLLRLSGGRAFLRPPGALRRGRKAAA